MEPHPELIKVVEHYRNNYCGIGYTIVRANQRHIAKRSHPDEELFFDRVEKVIVSGVTASLDYSISCTCHENGARGETVYRAPEDIYTTREAAIAVHRLEILQRIGRVNRLITEQCEYVRRLACFGTELDEPLSQQPFNAQAECAAKPSTQAQIK